MASLTYVSVIVLLTEALTLIYQTTRIPNFSLGQTMVLGAYAGVTLVQILGYPSIAIIFPAAFVVGLLVSLLVSLLVIEPLIKRGRDTVLITLSTMGVGIVLEGLMYVYSEWITKVFPQTSGLVRYRLFLREYDFSVGGVSGTFLISNITALLTVFLFRYMYRHTRFGSTVRGLTESSDLLQIQGVNPVRIRIVTWAIAGGLAGLAGSFMVMRFHTTIYAGFAILPTVFAASLLGGIDNPKGAAIGGIIVGFSEIVLIDRGMSLIGPLVGEWRFLVPLFFIVFMMALWPQGFLGQDFEEFNLGKKSLTRGQFVLVFILLLFGYLAFDATCRINLSRAHDGLLAEFATYDIVVAERDRDVSCIASNNFTSFKHQLERYNISTVYLEPYSELDRYLTFYFEKRNRFYRTVVRIEYYGVCQYRVTYE